MTDRFVGVIRFTRSNEPSPENARFPAQAHASLRAYEFVVDDDGFIAERRGFDAAGKRVNIVTGAPLPAPPEGVPPQATPNSDGDWELWRCDLATETHGVLRTWNSDGKLKKELQIEPNGDRITTRFWRKTAQPMERTDLRGVTAKIVGGFSHLDVRDETVTYFNGAGQALYSVRKEQVNDHHLRRSYDDHLVFEVVTKAKHRPDVRYFDLDGKLLVDYVPGKPGAGVFRLFDRAGKVEVEYPIDDEADRTKYGNWSRFLPAWANYSSREHERAKAWTETDPVCIRSRFLEFYEDDVGDSRLLELEPSRELAAELKAFDWPKLHTTAAGAGQLRGQVIGFLGADSKLAEDAAGKLWFQIVDEQGDADGVYDSTYAVATVVARMLPKLTDKRVVGRALDLLCKLLAIDWLTKDDKRLYAALTKALVPAAPLLTKDAHRAIFAKRGLKVATKPAAKKRPASRR